MIEITYETFHWVSTSVGSRIQKLGLNHSSGEKRPETFCKIKKKVHLKFISYIAINRMLRELEISIIRVIMEGRFDEGSKD